MYLFFIQNDIIIGKGQCECFGEDVINIEVTEEQYNLIIEKGKNYFIYQNGEIIINPNYEQEQKEKEKERINNLTMTALDFINVLKGFGLTAVQINTFIENNVELKLQLFGCQNVWCGVAKQVFVTPITIGNITITSEMVEQAFKDKTGENDEN